ncbi:MAG: hypothetical protein NTW99_09085, partial [Chloroflexi bacterium]|nr:hypothetical protein [Chloroflexota bacterium]
DAVYKLTDGFRLVAGRLEGGNEFEIHMGSGEGSKTTEQEFCSNIKSPPEMATKAESLGIPVTEG